MDLFLKAFKQTSRTEQGWKVCFGRPYYELLPGPGQTGSSLDPSRLSLSEYHFIKNVILSCNVDRKLRTSIPNAHVELRWVVSPSNCNSSSLVLKLRNVTWTRQISEWSQGVTVMRLEGRASGKAMVSRSQSVIGNHDCIALGQVHTLKFIWCRAPSQTLFVKCQKYSNEPLSPITVRELHSHCQLYWDFDKIGVVTHSQYDQLR